MNGEIPLAKILEAKRLMEAAAVPKQGRILWDGEKFIDGDTGKEVKKERKPKKPAY